MHFHIKKHPEKKNKRKKTKHPLSKSKYLRPQNNSTFFKKQSEITCQIKTPCNPSSFGHIQLGPTSLPETLHVPHRPPKRFGIRRFPITNPTKIFYRYHSFSLRQLSEEPHTGSWIGHDIVFRRRRSKCNLYRVDGLGCDLKG